MHVELRDPRLDRAGNFLLVLGVHGIFDDGIQVHIG
jgi:hypothetical protein